MRIQLTAILAAALSVGCILGAEKTQVDIYINSHDDSALLLGSGTVLASGIYEKIGVHLNWCSSAPKAAMPGRTVYSIRTLAHAPESVAGYALASSELFVTGGTEITIYKDRMALLPRQQPEPSQRGGRLRSSPRTGSPHAGRSAPLRLRNPEGTLEH